MCIAHALSGALLTHMAKDYNGKTILWVVMYQEPYDCDWQLAGIYEDIEGATAHVACIASPYSGEEYKIESRNISSTEECVQRYKDKKERQAKDKDKDKDKDKS